MTKIYLIRHGEAEGNVFRRLHGQYDSLLTPRGMAQVALLERRFAGVEIDGCFASDLTRASLTARSIYVSRKMPLHRDARFREIDVGSWEDVPYGYLDTFQPEGMRLFNEDPQNWHVAGSERFDDYTERFLEGMRQAAEEFDGGTVAIFGHGAVIRGTLMRLFFRGNPKDQPYSDNTGVSCLVYDHGQFAYDFLNDNSHLPEELSTFYIQRWWRTTNNRKASALYYLPLGQALPPEGLALPPIDPAGEALCAMLLGRPVGVVSMGGARDGTGTLLGMALLPETEGRYYADQMLGCAFSRFRRMGCTRLYAAPGAYPDDVLRRYEFDEETRQRNISTGIFDWGDTCAAQ